MGCDIHAFVEYQPGEWRGTSTYWWFGSEFRLDRCYMLFSHMVGVRNRGPEPVVPVTEPRGLPPDMSLQTSTFYDKQKGDAHDESWMTLPEFEEAVRRTEEEAGHPIDFEYRALIAAMKELPNVRLLFWFDN